MIGIYKITNKINNKIYIGCSTNIEERIKTHKRIYNDKSNKEYHKVLYQAFRKHGVENFKFEILEECHKKILFELEKYYIRKLCTSKDYNQTIGGDASGIDNKGENHPNSKLTKQDVINIRNDYKNKKRKNEVYKKYKDKINKTGFHKVWNGYTWTQVKMEVYTKDNKKFHNNNTANPGSKNGRAKLTENDVISIRMRKKNKENMHIVYKDYEDKLTKGSFRNVWCGYNWKHIIV